MVYKVLIVDDSMTSRLIIQRCCQIAGWNDAEFIHAADGKAALDVIHSRPVDLILSDYNMPMVDGLELAETLHREHFIPGVPMAIITSAKNETLSAKLTALGVVQVFGKPITPQELSKLLQKLDI